MSCPGTRLKVSVPGRFGKVSRVFGCEGSFRERKVDKNIKWEVPIRDEYAQRKLSLPF